MAMTQHLTFRDTCPYCVQPFKMILDAELKTEGLNNYLVRPHDTCPEFLIFVDAKGKIRGTQIIDSNYTMDKKELESYLMLFEDETNDALFYHFQRIDQDIVGKKQNGVIQAKGVQWHQLLRSEFYKQWLLLFKEKKQDFAFIFFNDIILATINLYDMIQLTVGFEPLRVLSLENSAEKFDLIKSKVVALGEKLLSTS
jgi:hypothetical protein